jgi:hypothetical protein
MVNGTGKIVDVDGVHVIGGPEGNVVVGLTSLEKGATHHHHLVYSSVRLSGVLRGQETIVRHIHCRTHVHTDMAWTSVTIDIADP